MRYKLLALIFIMTGYMWYYSNSSSLAMRQYDSLKNFYTHTISQSAQDIQASALASH